MDVFEHWPVGGPIQHWLAVHNVSLPLASSSECVHSLCRNTPTCYCVCHLVCKNGRIFQLPLKWFDSSLIPACKFWPHDFVVILKTTAFLWSALTQLLTITDSVHWKHPRHCYLFWVARVTFCVKHQERHSRRWATQDPLFDAFFSCRLMSPKQWFVEWHRKWLFHHIHLRVDHYQMTRQYHNIFNSLPSFLARQWQHHQLPCSFASI